MFSANREQPEQQHPTVASSSAAARSWVWWLAVAAVAFGLGWSARGTQQPGGQGKVVGVGGEPPAFLSRSVNFSQFWDVWDYLHQNAYEQPLADTKLFYGSLAGMVAGLNDPYSIFMDPEQAEQFNQELEGTFYGIGAEIGIRNKNLVVIAPLPGTPAERAGLKAGDRIVGINDQDTTGMPVDYAVGLIRGDKGTTVTLYLLSNDEREPREVKIVRDKITVQEVTGELKELPGGRGRVAYIKVSQFSQDVDERFGAMVAELKAKGANGLILDLRNNPGGYLDQAIALSGHWLTRQVVVRERFADSDPKDHQANGKGELKTFPTVILVNQGSASASEIVTGALQDWGLATVVGEQTFGKGSVQDLQDFPDGSAVKLTIAKWFTPKDRTIDKTGLAPDIEVKRTREDIDADEDPQLSKALELLAR